MNKILAFPGQEPPYFEAIFRLSRGAATTLLVKREDLNGARNGDTIMVNHDGAVFEAVLVTTRPVWEV